jgi:hypothetical protein
VGRATHTKTLIVVPVVGIVVVAIAEARMALSIVPRAAAHHTPRYSPDGPTGLRTGEPSMASIEKGGKKNRPRVARYQ